MRRAVNDSSCTFVFLLTLLFKIPEILCKNTILQKPMITFYSNTKPDMEKNWQNIAVMTEENIHLFPHEYQDFFSQLKENGGGYFPKKEKGAISAKSKKIPGPTPPICY